MPDYKKAFEAYLNQTKQNVQSKIAYFQSKLSDFSGSNMQMAAHHLSQGNFSDAALRYRMVTWKAPKNADAWAGLAEALMLSAHLKDGEEAARKALTLQPGHPKATKTLADIEAVRAAEPAA